MHEAEWLTRKGRLDTPLRSLNPAWRLEGLFALADPLEEWLAKARGQEDKLTPSLLARAFTGKLVPQDPADEPAEKLLERIREQSEFKSHRDARK